MNNGRYWSVKESKKYASTLGISLTNTTIRSWTVKYTLGHKIGGKYVIDIDKFTKFLSGEFT